MTVFPRRRRQRTLVALATGLVVAVLIPVAVVVGARATTTSSAAVNVGSTPSREIPATPAAFMGTVDDEGQLTSITVFALAPGGSGGTVISVPVGTKVELGVDEASLETARLADVYATGGLDALWTSLESVLRVTFARGEVLERDDVARHLAPAGIVDVSYPVELLDSTADGDVVVLTAGPHQLDAEGLADVLLARRNGELESARLPFLRTLWDGVSTAVGEGRPSTADPLAGQGEVPADLRSFIAAVMSGSTTAYQFGYTPVDSDEENPDGLDMYALDLGEVVLVLGSVAPSSVVAANPAATVQIDSSFDFETTKAAVTRMLFVGANVLLVRQVPGPAPEATVIRSTVPLSEEENEALEVLMGPVVIEEQDDPVAGIELQVILGADFVTFLEENENLPTEPISLGPDEEE
jgi:hypothetical protein